MNSRNENKDNIYYRKSDNLIIGLFKAMERVYKRYYEI